MASKRHILLRFNDHLKYDTIQCHKEVIDANGFVWFGKIGSPVSKVFILSCQDSIQAGEKVNLFLVKSKSSNNMLYKSEILHITNSDLRKSPDNIFIPEYYRHANHNIHCWFKLNKLLRLPSSYLGKLSVASSTMPVLETIGSSMSGILYVEYKDQVIKR